jgi:hypothetical protein
LEVNVMSRNFIADACPLSPLQQGMLFHHLQEPHAGVDIEQLVVRTYDPSWDQVERGVPLAQVRDLLGHASILTTERVGHHGAVRAADAVSFDASSTRSSRISRRG